jgi:acetyltransferase-like isoleucine patch superfamily enzyme
MAVQAAASKSAEPAVRLEWRPRALVRVGWTLLTILVVESLIFGLSVLPAALFWDLFFARQYPSRPVAIVVLSMAFIPTYLIFAFSLMMFSAWATGALNWRTPRDAEMRIGDLDWPLMDWARYMASVHVVRLFAGAVFRATPLWAMYLRANGARLGKGVYINSLAVNDHNMLDFDDHVVIGDDVHLSGHTVERGFVKTATVRLGRNCTIGLGSVVGIGVTAGAGCQVGALSLVPKFTHLEANTTYVGTPVRKLDRGPKL